MFDAFLSYARADDEAFVATLHERLIAAGFRVWYDRTNMPSRGETFLREIQHAIDESDRLIAVVGPAAVKSDHVRAEWDYAQLFSKAVVPILRAGAGLQDIPAEVRSREYELIPAELRHFHCPDFRRDRDQTAAFAELERILRQPVTAPGDPHQVPQLPPHFLPRRELLRHVAETLLVDAFRPVTIVDAAQQTTLVHGLPGAGKSVIAGALARAVSVRRSFRDGVVWLSMTETPDLLRQWRRLGDAFDDDISHYVDRHRAEDRLGDLLHDRECLIVMDDIWLAQHVTPVWNALGPRCRLLLTARDKAIGRTFGAAACQADVLTTGEARSLLAQWAETPLQSLPVTAERVLEETGRLPMALAICGGMVKAKVPWDDIVDALTTADLSFLEHELANYPYPHVMRALQASVDHLGRADASAPQRYYELAVFVPQRQVPERAVVKLWSLAGLTERQARKLLATFDSASLLSMTESDPRAVQLHDLQWDYVTGHNADPKALHHRLVAAYGQPASWPSIPDDGYFFDNIARHLTAAAPREDARSLVSRPWMQAQFGRTLNHRAFASDLDLIVGDLASERPVDVAALVRASLVRATVSALSTRIPPAALIAIAACGDVGKALGFAELMVEPALRVEAFTGIAAAVHGHGDAQGARRLLSMAVAAALRVENRDDPDAAVTDTIRAWVNTLGHADLNALPAIAADDRDRDRLQRITAKWIPPDVSGEPTPDDGHRPASSDDWHVWETAASRIEHGAVAEGFALIAAAKYALSYPLRWAPFSKAMLTCDSVLRSLPLWNTIEDERLRFAVLADLAGELARAGRIDEARAAARAIAEPLRRDAALASVADAADKAGQRDVAETIVDEMSEGFKAAGLAMLASLRADAGVADDARALARRAEAAAVALDADDRVTLIDAVLATVFVRTGDHADAEGCIARVEAYIRTTADESVLESAMTSIFPALVRIGRPREAVALLDSVKLSSWRKPRVVGLLATPLVEIGEGRAAIELATRLESYERPEFLARLVPTIVARGEYDVAVSSLTLVEHDFQREDVLKPLTKALLDAGAFREALTALDALGNHSRPAAAETIALRLVEAGQTALALEAARLGGAGTQAHVLAHVARTSASRGRTVDLQAIVTAPISDELKGEVLKGAALGWRDAGVLDRAFDAAMFAPASERSGILSELVVSAVDAGNLSWSRNLLPTIERDWDRSKAAQALVNAYLKTDRLDDAFAVARAMTDTFSGDRTAMLFQVLERAIAADRLDMAAAVADSLGTREAKARALAGIARARAAKGDIVAARADLDEVLSLSLAVPAEDVRARALSAVGRLLADSNHASAALAIANAVNGVPRAEVLGAVAAAQAVSDLPGALDRVTSLEAFEEFGVRWIEADALLALARVCLEQQRNEQADELARQACAKSLAAFSRQDVLLRSIGTTVAEQLAAAHAIFARTGTPHPIHQMLQTDAELLKYKRDDILAAIAEEAARCDRREEALRLVALIGKPEDALDALNSVARRLAERNDVSGAREAIRRTRALVATASVDWRRIEAVGGIAANLVRIGDVESWTNELEAAVAGSGEPVACRAVSTVGLALAESGHQTEARQWLDRMPKDPPSDSEAAVALASMTIGAGSDAVAIADRLLRSAPELDSAYGIRTRALVHASRVFIAARDLVRAMHCLAECDVDEELVRETVRGVVAAWHRQRPATHDAEGGAAYWYDACRSGRERWRQDAMLGTLCAALADAGSVDVAVLLFARAVADARSGSRATLFDLVRRAAPLIAALDAGRVLVSLSREMTEIDTWWQLEAS